MKRKQPYTVQYAAIYNVTVVVHAEDEDDAINRARAADWVDMVDEDYDRPHPDTEYFVEEEPYDD